MIGVHVSLSVTWSPAKITLTMQNLYYIFSSPFVLPSYLIFPVYDHLSTASTLTLCLLKMPQERAYNCPRGTSAGNPETLQQMYTQLLVTSLSLLSVRFSPLFTWYSVWGDLKSLELLDPTDKLKD